MSTIYSKRLVESKLQRTFVIFDNASVHGDHFSELPCVEYIFLPASVSSLYQPMDEWINTAIKKRTRTENFRQVMEMLPNKDELTRIGKNLKRKFKLFLSCSRAGFNSVFGEGFTFHKSKNYRELLDMGEHFVQGTNQRCTQTSRPRRAWSISNHSSNSSWAAVFQCCRADTGCPAAGC